MSISKYGSNILDIDDIDDLDITPSMTLGEASNLLNRNDIPTKRQYDNKLDVNQYKFVGWDQQANYNPIINKLFTKQTIQTIQSKTSEYLTGVDSKGRRIVPSEDVVVEALYGVFDNYLPETGDIYGKYLVRNGQKVDHYSYIVDMTISLLVRGISTELGMEQNNQKLTIWTTVLGDFNEHGLRQYPPIKVKDKRPDPFLFHMRY